MLARRKHNKRLRETELAALAGPPTGQLYGRTNSVRTRTAVLDDEDEEDHTPSSSPMAERFPGATVASRASGSYGTLLNNPFEHSDDTDDGPGERVRGGDSTPSGLELAGGGYRTSDEGAGLIAHGAGSQVSPPASSDYHGLLPIPPRAPERLRTNSGPDPAAWLGGKDVPYPVDLGTELRDAGAFTPPPSSPLPGGMPSSIGHGSDPFIDSSGSDMDHLMMSSSPRSVAYPGMYASGSGSNNASRLSVEGGAYAGSSAHDHSSGSAHGHTGSSSGHGHPVLSVGHGASGSSIGHHTSPVLEGRRSPGPSSLLPTQTLSPPTAYRGVSEDKEGDFTSRKRSGSFLGRQLRWVRGGRSPSSSSISPVSQRASMSSQVLLNNTVTAQFSTPHTESEPPPPGVPMITRQGPSSASLSSVFRQQSPTLSTLPPAVFAQYGTIPESSVPRNIPVWPGLGVLANQGMPSPALTERSSHHAPEGLLDPGLGTQLGTQGMSSTAAISLRDDIDYSRPIGGVSFLFRLMDTLANWTSLLKLVNNRMYSSSSIPTTTTTPEPTRRDSGESERSHYTTSAYGSPSPYLS